ncbi:TonB-dependent siderophore receptor [Myxacorys almedinensis]|uniref:TonB-dependent siderophore receptor n=1 Tax=Myxacorys almedinensis A TaxID=2690445 RepID=A0A8J7Z093_9CYAN|nr:TonB-dependent siderophore receptor [Myxacorys almedinensis]NDJ15743.1 TonB-dependent siderophore receptor [Myxacorys almedinensis A]
MNVRKFSVSTQLMLMGVVSSSAIAWTLPGWAQLDSKQQKPLHLTPFTPTISTTRQHHFSRSATTLREWVAQIEAATVQVTGVNLNRTDTGLEIVLQTAEGKPLQVDATKFRSEGNSLIADIPNAVLTLPEGNEFRSENPVTGITAVNVTQVSASNISVIVTGTNALPTTDITLRTGEFAYSLNPEESEPDEEIVVTGEQNSYRVPNAATGTRTDTPIRDIPQSIQVIPQQVLKDQSVIRLTDALRNVSGVVQSGGFGQTDDQLNIRGFDAATILRDGLIDLNGLRETTSVEQIEVLKGPASILFGNVQPGGVINLVSKRPLREPYYFADFSAGSFSFYRPTIDFSGPLNPEKTVLYRLNAAYENAGSFRDFVDSQRFFIEPVLDFKIGNNTTLSLNLNYLYDDRTFDRGLVAFGRGIADIPRSRFLGEPDDNSEIKDFNVGYRLEHRFSENLTLRNVFRFGSQDSLNFRAEPLGLDESTGELLRNYRSNDTDSRIYSLQTELVGKFATGSVQHTLLLGLDFFRQTQDFTRTQLRGGLTPTINIFDPIYSFLQPSALNDPATRTGFNSVTKTDSLGVFLQDQIALADNLKLLVGGRFDVVDQKSEFLPFDESEVSESGQSDQAFTPRIGIVYQPIQPISLYASYSRSFVPSFGQRVDGSLLEPERGTQYEVGIKADLNRRLSATLALYQITKTNIATPDLANEGFSLAIGEQRNRGIELDIAGEILPGWRILTSYSYTNAEITKSNDLPVGATAALVPQHKASLWTTYEIQRGNLRGLGFGLGLFYVDARPGDLDSSYTLPSYFRTDAAIFYQRDNWKAAINLKNLFDVNSFESINYGRVSVVPGAPFTVVGSLSVNF